MMGEMGGAEAGSLDGQAPMFILNVHPWIQGKNYNFTKYICFLGQP